MREKSIPTKQISARAIAFFREQGKKGGEKGGASLLKIRGVEHFRNAARKRWSKES